MDIDRNIRICGIYKITNRINGRAYIGQSIDIYNRWAAHIANKNKKYLNYYFVCALRKYGEDAFDWEILEECDESFLDEREEYYIDKFNTFIGNKGNLGYNMTRGGDGYKSVGVKVYQYDMQGNFIQRFNTIEIAAKSTKSNATGIVNCCRGRRKMCNNFIWSYTYKEYIESYKSSKQKKVCQYTKNMEYIKTFDSVTDAANFVNKTKSQLSMCCRGRTPSCGGYIWRYKE